MNRLLLCSAVLVLSMSAAQADTADYPPLSGVTQTNVSSAGITLHCGNGVLQVTALAPDIVRVRCARTDAALANDHSWALAEHPWPAVTPRITQSAQQISIATDAVTVKVDLNPIRIRFEDKTGRVVNEDARPVGIDNGGRAMAVYKHLGVDEHIYGLGEKAAHLDKRRGHFEMWTTDRGDYHDGTDPLYQSIPFYIGLTGGQAYGLFYDNSYRSYFDIASFQPENAVYSVEGGPVDYYYLAGPSMTHVVERYTDLTGHIPMVPEWALGNQQSRYSYFPAQQATDIVQDYRRHHFPLDVLHLDIHYMDGYRVFTWSPKGFPDPAAFVGNLLKLGVHVVTIIDPGVKHEPGYRVYEEGLKQNFFVRHDGGDVYVGRVWPGESVFVDYTLESARRWWGDLHKTLVDAGVSGIWNDMNEPADFVDKADEVRKDLIYDDHGSHTHFDKNRNVFALLEARATYEGLLRLRPKERPFVITRAGYAGVQRYSTVWTGDIAGTWDSLELSCPMFESMGLCGESFVGNDIGGFLYRCSGELLVRWYQVSFLVPLCRNHHVIDSYDQEPWRFGEPYASIIRHYLNLRYQLMPYLYTALEQSHRTGLPIIRPLVLNWQNDENTYNLDDEFMVGDDLLLAPVTAPHQTERFVYLPAGLWYDFYSRKPIRGGRAFRVNAPLDTVPLYVRAGTVLPMGSAMDYVGQVPHDPIQAVVFPDGAGHARSTLYVDDSHQDGPFARYSLKADGDRFTCTRVDGTWPDQHPLRWVTAGR